MPNYDLSSASIGRVAGQTVDRLMIANQIVWQAAPTSSELRLLSGFTPPSFNNPGLYSFGMRVSRTTAFKAFGGYWYHRTTEGPLTLTPRFYNATTEAILASNTSISTSGFPDQSWVKVLFSAPFNALADTQYVLAIEAEGVSSFESTSFLPQSESGFTVHEGRYLGGGGFPTNTWSGLHGVGLNWGESD